MDNLTNKTMKKIDKGLGDTIARAIKTVSRGKIQECGGCTKRKEFLNKKFPYKND
jgi:hypothetical protein|tara:strand:+ start:489 stop:653 length:165 start_codon:yes stop_codon:yes gene_type:complete